MIEKRDPEMMTSALFYAARGWPVFPCSGKKPRTDNGLHGATTDPAQIREWWKKWPNANIAIATGLVSGVYVVDEDEGGAPTIAALDLPETLTVKTANGRHLYFKRPDGDRWQNSTKKLGPGVDTRGDGGYVLAPPSIHPETKKVYEWVNETADLAALPESVLARLRPPPPRPAPVFVPRPDTPSSYGDKALSSECEKVAHASEGERNHTLNTAAYSLGQLVGGGVLSESAVRAELTSAAQSCGLDDAEIKQTLASGLKAGKSNPRYPPERPAPPSTKRIEKPKHEGADIDDPEAWPIPAEIESIGAPAPRFPVDALPKFLADFVDDTADRMQAPPEYVAFPALVALAGAIGKGVRLRPKRCDPWSVPAILWATNIGRPGSLKSPTQKEALRPLGGVEAKWVEEDKGKIDEWQKLEEANKAKDDADQEDIGEKPNMRRLIVNNATVEVLSELLAKSPRGLTLVSDELSGWLENMGRYNKGSDVQFYLSAYDGEGGTVDRLGRGTTFVRDAHLNVVGGIQPEVVRAFFEGRANDGLLDRFGLMAFPDMRADFRLVDRWPNSAALAAYRETVVALAHTTWRDHFRLGDGSEHTDECCYVRFAADAQELWNAWYTQHNKSKAQWSATPEAGMMAKAEGLVARLALVMHLGSVAAREQGRIGEISRDTLTSALRLFHEYLRPTWRRLFHVFGASLAEDSARKIAARILEKKMATIRPGDITRLEWKGVHSRKDVLDAFAILVDADWIAKPDNKSKGRGRPSASYTVNPLVHGLFGVSTGEKGFDRDFSGSTRTPNTPKENGNPNIGIVPGFAESKSVEAIGASKSTEPARANESHQEKPGTIHQIENRRNDADLGVRVNPEKPGTNGFVPGATVAGDEIEDLWGPK